MDFVTVASEEFKELTIPMYFLLLPSPVLHALLNNSRIKTEFH